MPSERCNRTVKETLPLNNKNHQEYIKNAVKPKFHGLQSIKSRAVPRYPASSERELQRISRQYLNIFRDTLKERLPAIIEDYRKERQSGARYDDVQDLNSEIKEEMKRVSEETEQRVAAFGLIALIEKAKKTVIKAVNPEVRLDGKSRAYIDAAFDCAAEAVRKRSVKDTSYQKRQMFNADGRDFAKANQGTSARSARQRMIERHNNSNKEGK